MATDEQSEPFLGEEPKGTLVNESENQDDGDEYPTPWRARLLENRIPNRHHLAAITFLATSLLWGSILFYVLYQQRTYYHISGDYAERNYLYGMPISGYKFMKCGTSVEEARSLGCFYDIQTNHWTPGACLDTDAVKEYQSDESWYGYAYENRTSLLNSEVMGELPHYFTSARDHINHCAMLWRRQYRAFTEGHTNIDSITMDPEHTSHCAQYLVDMTDRGEDFREEAIRVDVGFAGCFLLD